MACLHITFLKLSMSKKAKKEEKMLGVNTNSDVNTMVLTEHASAQF